MLFDTGIHFSVDFNWEVVAVENLIFFFFLNIGGGDENINYFRPVLWPIRPAHTKTCKNEIMLGAMIVTVGGTHRIFFFCNMTDRHVNMKFDINRHAQLLRSGVCLKLSSYLKGILNYDSIALNFK